MADATSQPPRRALPRIDKAWAACLLIPLALLALDPAAVPPVLTKAATSLASTAPFILFATLAVALLKATGAESLLARAFEGRQSRMILMAALLGGLSPFCSCEVIPFIAALLAVGGVDQEGHVALDGHLDLLDHQVLFGVGDVVIANLADRYAAAVKA